MKNLALVYQDNYYEAYDTEFGTRVVLAKDNSSKGYWRVSVVLKTGKVMTIATRCVYQRALEIASCQ